MKQVNDTFRNGSILNVETKQLFKLGEYEMYRMEGLTRQGGGGEDISRYRVCSDSKLGGALINFDWLQGRLSVYLSSLRLGS